MTIKRATVTGGVRYDHVVGYVNDSTLPPSRWIRRILHGVRVEHWKDISRGWHRLRLFGNGKTRSRPASPVLARRATHRTSQQPAGQIGRTDARTCRI